MNARDVLHDHAIERYLRAAVRSLCLDDDLRSAVKRMSPDQWVTSCLLCAGVDGRTLDILGMWLCEQAGSAWAPAVVEVQGEVVEVRKEQVAVRLTLVEAAWRVGHKLDYPAVRKLKAEAEQVVAENLVRRAEREP